MDGSIAKMVFVSILWGSTNPLIKKFSSGIENCQSSVDQILFLLCRPLYLLSLLGNQMGSFLFYLLLGSTDLGIAVPVVNSMTLLFTAVVGALLGEGRLGWKGAAGTLLIVLGTGLCNAERG